MGFSTVKYSLKGGRAQNEDAVCVINEGQLFLSVVADGLGMHGGGDIASEAAVKVITDCYKHNTAIDERSIADIFKEANEAILAKQDNRCKMKSTIAALFSNEGKLAFAHIGDTRIYRFYDGRIIFQTKDHSVTQAAVYTGEISEYDIRFHEDRNRLLRALGGEGKTYPDLFMPEDKISGNDAFLLCTDGFWEYVWESEMEIDLIKSNTPEQWVSYMLARIGKRIDGKNDNLSVVAIFYDDLEGQK